VAKAEPNRSKPPRWEPPNFTAIVLLLGGMILALALNAAYTTWAVSQSQHRWCNTIGLLNAASAASTKKPTGPYGRQLAADFAQLFPALGCGR
jgi:hypothetical protein